MPGTLSPLDISYTLELTVSKNGKMPAKASVQVSILGQQVPTLSMLISCHRNEIDQSRCCTDKHSQLMSANLNSKIVMTATSDTANTSFEWTVSPAQKVGYISNPTWFNRS
jgi:hypothetical protein